MSTKFTIGKNVKLISCNIGYHSRVAEQATVSDSTIGDYSAIGRYTKITHTSIGKYCAISWDTTINAISHPYDNLSISAFPYVPYVGNFVERREQHYNRVVIKNDVWVGANCVIMPGVTIGNGAIIGAGAVVTCNVPDYAIFAGVPAKLIRYRFEKAIIDELLRIKWWDFDKNKIKKNISLWQNKVNAKTIDLIKKL